MYSHVTVNDSCRGVAGADEIAVCLVGDEWRGVNMRIIAGVRILGCSKPVRGNRVMEMSRSELRCVIAGFESRKVSWWRRRRQLG